MAITFKNKKMCRDVCVCLINMKSAFVKASSAADGHLPHVDVNQKGRDIRNCLSAIIRFHFIYF